MKKKRFAGKIIWTSAFGVVLTLVLPTMAFAAEESSGMDLLIPKMVEFIPMCIAFVVLWVIFAKFAYPIIMGIVNKRSDTIKNDLQNAEDSKIEAAKLQEQSAQELDDAKVQAAKIIDDAKKSAQVEKSKIEEDARVEAQSIIDKGNAVLESDRKLAAAELQESVADISISVAAKLIGNNLSDEEHRQIIERYVEEAGSLNA